MGRILISCAEADRAAGEALRKRLAADGMAAQIVADGSVAREEDLAECRIYILLFSQRANESTQMLQALQKAVASGTVVIPLRLTEEKMADGYHYYLSTIHWLDGTNQRLDGAIEQLCRRCASILSAAESTKPDAGGKKRLIQWLAALLAVAGIVTAFFLLRPNAGTGYPGDTLRFGRYEQDGNASNGPEPIEWIVADEKDGILLLVSAQCLDVMPYNDQDAATTWETCSLRQWLNEDFVDKAFTEAEREQIAIAQVENSKNGSALESAGGIGLF